MVIPSVFDMKRLKTYDYVIVNTKWYGGTEFKKSQGTPGWVVFRKDIYNKEYLKNLNLNDRQIDALLFFKDKGEIVNSEYVERYSITDRTARYDLTDLVDKNLLIRTGERKAAKYVFPINFR